MSRTKKKSTLVLKRKTSQVERASTKFAEDYGDVALALEIMRNSKLSKAQPRYRTNRLTYRSP